MSQPEPYEDLVLGSGEGGKYLAWHLARSALPSSSAGGSAGPARTSTVSPARMRFGARKSRI